MHLVLNTFGSGLQVDNGLFLVKSKEGSKKLPPEKVRSISISKGAKISSNAALLAIEYEIGVMFVDRTGTPAGRVWSVKYGSISTIRKQQLNFSRSEQAVTWIKYIVTEKMDNQIALLLSFELETDNLQQKVNSTINKLEDYKTKISKLEAPFVQDIAPTIRGWEGAASKSYFSTISPFLPEKYQFTQRTKHPATDVFNAMLNYGYGMMYGKVEGALIKAGIDPYLGVFHRDEYNRPVFVYDAIEKFRVWIDYVVISLAMQDVLDDDSYSIKEDGSYWLESMGKRILIQSVNDYLDEIITMDGKDRSRANHIDLWAEKLANKILHYKVKFEKS